MKSKILVVDDEADVVRAVQLQLEQEGYTVMVAGDGEDAMQQVAAELPDLILMDVMMPHMDGFEALRQLKADPATAHIQVVMLTALDPARHAAKGEGLGCDFYWVKPYVMSDLLAFIGHVLADYKDA